MKTLPLGLERRWSWAFLRGAQQKDECPRLQAAAREILSVYKEKKSVQR